LKLVESSRTRVQGYVIFGNGQRDERIFGAISSKFNDKISLSSPLLSHETGLSAAFKSIAKLAELVSSSFKYIIVIDREHMDESRLKSFASEHGFELQSLRKLGGFAYLLKVKRGGRVADIYIAVSGFKKNIEENVAKLIEKCYGENVEPSKEAIKEWLRRRNQTERDLIEKASKEVLEESFPGIVAVIKSFIEDTEVEKARN
jgi:hypothetical protein